MVLSIKKTISLLSVPFGLAAGRSGAQNGPQGILETGLLRKLQSLDIAVYPEHEILNTHLDSTDENVASDPTLKCLKEVVTVNERLAAAVSRHVGKGLFPLILGGDHSIAIGTLAGLTQHYQNLGVIWFDAHSDLNTHTTTPSGNIHGMSLAASLGLGHPSLTGILTPGAKIRPEHVVLIGVRQLDEGEKAYIREAGITCFTMHQIDRLGMNRVMEEALAIVSKGTDGVHLSFDIDSVDPTEAPGTGSPVKGGVSYREAHLALELMHESGLITSAEFVEVNPELDTDRRTARLAGELIGSLLGQQIL